MKEIARQAEVSLAVVSAVVNNTDHTRMSEVTRRRVEDVISRMGYVPNHAARSLRRRQTGTIALVLHKIDNPVLHEMVHGVHDAAATLGRTVILADAEWFSAGGSLLSQLLGEGIVDGIVVHTQGALDADVRDQLTRRPRPVVTLENVNDSTNAWVSIDDVDAGDRATQHLINLGHRRIAWAGDPQWRSTRLRRDGYRDAMRRSHLPELTFAVGFGFAAGHDIVDALRRSAPRPTAVVAHNASAAIGLVAAAADAGLVVPADLSVVGIHDLEVAEHIRPALTCVRPPVYELGARGVRMVHALALGQPVSSGVITNVSNQLMIRDSTAQPR